MLNVYGMKKLTNEQKEFSCIRACSCTEWLQQLKRIKRHTTDLWEERFFEWLRRTSSLPASVCIRANGLFFNNTFLILRINAGLLDCCLQICGFYKHVLLLVRKTEIIAHWSNLEESCELMLVRKQH